jgi:hypothetical protein
MKVFIEPILSPGSTSSGRATSPSPWPRSRRSRLRGRGARRSVKYASRERFPTPTW